MIESKILRNPLLIDNLLTHEFVTVKKKKQFSMKSFALVA